MINHSLVTIFGTGLVTTNRKGVIVEASSIYKWTIGNDYNYIINYLISKFQFYSDEITNAYITETEEIEDEELKRDEAYSIISKDRRE